MAEKRAELKKKNEKLNVKEFAAQCGGEWKDLSDSEKERFQKIAAVDKKRYETAMKSYTPPERDSDDSSEDAPKNKKAKKDPNAPKRARNSFLIYSMDERPKVTATGLKGKEVLPEIGKRWAKLSDDKKKPYEDKAATEKERYETEMKAYNNKK